MKSYSNKWAAGSGIPCGAATCYFLIRFGWFPALVCVFVGVTSLLAGWFAAKEEIKRRDLYDRVFTHTDPHSPYYDGEDDAEDDEPEDKEAES